MSRQNILIWGAGRIGRGFVADLFHAAGYRLVLVDAAADLVAQLREAGRYTVVRAPHPDRRQEVTIAGYSVLCTSDREAVSAAVAAADLLAVAVFPRQLPAVAGQLAPALLQRHEQGQAGPLNILLCTNLPQAGHQFRAALQQALPDRWSELTDDIGIVETLVIRMAVDPPDEVRAREPLLVWTNGYPDLLVDRHAFKGGAPSVPGLRPVADMRVQEQCKLYTYNLYQAALAYLGAARGHRLLVACIADPAVQPIAEGALLEARAALQAAYQLPDEELDRWVRGAMADTDNPLLGDAVARIAADPRRKLRRDDRLVGPALLAQGHSLPTDHLAETIAGALRYLAAEDATAIPAAAQQSDLEAVVRSLCGLTDATQPLVDDIVDHLYRLQLQDTWRAAAQRAYELGLAYETTYHGCGQCTVAAVLDTLDRFDESAFEAATALAGGIGLAGEDAPCGALMGALLSFGVIFPRRREHFDGDRENKYRAFAMAQRMRARYLAQYGDLHCHGIHQRLFGRAFDLRQADERAAFAAAGAHDDKCTTVVALAAQWAVEIIGEELMKDGLAAGE